MLQKLSKIILSPLYFAIVYAITASVFIIEAVTAQSLRYTFDFVGYGGTFAYHDLKILGLPAYWFLMIFGYLVNIWLLYNKRKSIKMNRAEALLIPTGFLFVSFLGGKLLYILENPSTSSTLEMNGLSLFGAIFIVPPVAWVTARLIKKSPRLIMDLCASEGLVLLVCVRTGCFITGCCGAPTIWLEEKPLILPVQLFEVVADLLILSVCSRLEKKKVGNGMLYPTMMVLYGTVRFVLEFFRKSPHLIFGITASQILALLCTIVGLIWFITVFRKEKNSIL